MPISIKDYKDIIKPQTCHLLLGNGFSIGCDPIFHYDSLFKAAKEIGLSDSAQEVFLELGTNNFEGVLHFLDELIWAGKLYGLPSKGIETIRNDCEIVKETLIKAVAKSHLDHTGCVSNEKKDAALRFLSPFKNIFTTNYDLLLYWIVLSNTPIEHSDGFHDPENTPDASYLGSVDVLTSVY